MATMRQIRDGLDILLRYGDGSVSADHDEFLAGPDHCNVSDEDREALSRLGWSWDNRHQSWRRFV